MKKQITFLALILAMGMIVVGCEKKQPIQDDQLQNQEQVEETKAEVRIKEKMKEANISDWNIYSNNEIGYLIAYPNTWECEDSSEKTDYITCRNIDRGEIKGTTPTIGINVRTNSDITDPIEFLNSIYKDSDYAKSIPKELNYEISDKKALKISSIEGNEVFGEHEVIHIYVENNEILVSIKCRVDDKGLKKEEIEKILKTIVFK